MSQLSPTERALVAAVLRCAAESDLHQVQSSLVGNGRLAIEIWEAFYASGYNALAAANALETPASDAEREAVNLLVGCLLASDREGAPLPLTGKGAAMLAREVARLRTELETRTNELHLVERELADAQGLIDATAQAKYGGALVEALGIAQAAGRRGLLSTREQERLREIAKVVPQ